MAPKRYQCSSGSETEGCVDAVGDPLCVEVTAGDPVPLLPERVRSAPLRRHLEATKKMTKVSGPVVPWKALLQPGLFREGRVATNNTGDPSVRASWGEAAM
ncbi:hypothetical protein NDU88_004870 [Pleurodeles waltl]|uniref:Uncharacterized protein n=1 Tax=Pleurodeles waltl TaxID=8319 RepID=A0AAV7T8Z7_PLEWA|nr:hypothetical protein NDU88_004870 [Pleurodeles waltl]